METLTVDSAGRLQLPRGLLRDLGRRPLQPVSQSDRHLLVGAADEEGELVLAGRLGEVSVPDLLSFLNMFRKSGVLHLRLEGGSRTLYFSGGDIINAGSTFAEDDLGEILCDQGRLQRDQLLRLREVAAGRGGLPRLLAEGGLVGDRDLWLAVRQRAEEIVYRLFGATGGSFAFFAREPAGQDADAPRISLRTQNLIMEGLRRFDERALFLRRLGSLDQRVVAGGGREEDLAPEEARVVAAAADGTLTVRDALRRSGLGELEGMRLLDGLVKKGRVTLEAPAESEPDGALGELLEIYNGALGALFRRIAAVHPEYLQEMKDFLNDLPRPFCYVLQSSLVRADGTLDGGRIAGNLAGLDAREQVRLLADALNETVFMACMAARRELAAEASAGLIRRVQELTGRVKTIAGRME